MSALEFEQMMEERLDMEIWVRGIGEGKVEKRKRAQGWLSRMVCGGV